MLLRRDIVDFELGCSPNEHNHLRECRQAKKEECDGSGKASGYCSNCPLTVIDAINNAWQGQLIHQVETLIKALRMPGINITLDEIQYDEWLLINIMEEEEKRYEVEKQEEQQRQQQYHSSSPPVSKID